VIPTRALSDDHTLPAIGLGTYGLRGEEGVAAVCSAIVAGYRLIDTAVSYENEAEVGRALARSGADRQDLAITTKVRGRDHDRARESVEESLERLGLERLDLVLVHWPLPSRDRYVAAWEGLIEAREAGLVRSIGVSNFLPEHLERIIAETGVTPVVNQVEQHPRFVQTAQQAVHDRLGIITEAWSPLGNRRPAYDEPAIADAATAHGVAPAQVVLRWQLQLGAIPVPKSATPSRHTANLDVFDFALSDGEVAAISALHRDDGRLFGGDPATFEEL